MQLHGKTLQVISLLLTDMRETETIRDCVQLLNITLQLIPLFAHLRRPIPSPAFKEFPQMVGTEVLVVQRPKRPMDRGAKVRNLVEEHNPEPINKQP